MNRIRLIELIRKKESGEISLPEQKELSDFIKEDGQYYTILQSLNIFNSDQSNFNAKENESTEAELYRLKEKIASHHKNSITPTTKLRKLPLFRLAAACIVLIVFAGFLLYHVNTGANSSRQSEFTTRKGSKSSIKLPDGTMVWMNADTRLTYDESFGKNTREVQLTGEAYFDVIKDKEKPFIVHTNTMDVKVLGTAFNVRAYAGEKDAATTLIRGSVEVILNKKRGEKITLAPNEKLIVQNNKQASNTGSLPATRVPDVQLLTINTFPVDSGAAETQWIKNKLVFEQEKLENIIPVLERWYNVDIELKSSYKKNVDLNGTFDNDKLEDVLESLKIIAGFNYKVQNNKVLIY